MSIADEISRLTAAKADLKTAIQAKGVTVPEGTKLDGYASLVGSISGGADTSDATAVAANIQSGKTAYIASGKVTGTMNNVSKTVTNVAAIDQVQRLVYNTGSGYISGGPYASYETVRQALSLMPDMVAQGNTILGLDGTCEADFFTQQVNTNDGLIEFTTSLTQAPLWMYVELEDDIAFYSFTLGNTWVNVDENTYAQENVNVAITDKTTGEQTAQQVSAVFVVVSGQSPGVNSRFEFWPQNFSWDNQAAGTVRYGRQPRVFMAEFAGFPMDGSVTINSSLSEPPSWFCGYYEDNNNAFTLWKGSDWSADGNPKDVITNYCVIEKSTGSTLNWIASSGNVLWRDLHAMEPETYPEGTYSFEVNLFYANESPLLGTIRIYYGV